MWKSHAQKSLRRRLLLATRTRASSLCRTTPLVHKDQMFVLDPQHQHQQRASFHLLSQQSSATKSGLSVQQQQQGNAKVPLALQQQQQQQIRSFETEAAYHRVADDTMEGLQDAVEQALEELIDVVVPDDLDISLASGVLTIYLPPHGTWVLNKQTPNQQLWWSSPLSGPKRFEYTDEKKDDDTNNNNVWFCTQNGLSLVPLLAQELSHVLKTEIELDVQV